ncbi:hypothetical protein H8R18_08725 [Nanchangia anserum]|uniref:Uncharacterized protein n=1 Tax=Nanchangia anserum TaxID=2692125 RepID=A0A8I0GC72_9ACTO|nr:hypothetical protein [Nanchangia anserum]MBD3689596.1 hypothetical protein [Nanchangia anserum]QOX81779.1 hypothetical protein H8R18_08725 [Nanchangia anserum]
MDPHGDIETACAALMVARTHRDAIVVPQRWSGRGARAARARITAYRANHESGEHEALCELHHARALVDQATAALGR